jgi:hypothetical protein
MYYVVVGGETSKKTRADGNGDPYLYHVADSYIWQLRELPRGYAVSAYLLSESNNYCPECYNVTLKKRTKTVCETCDGSGKLNAYKGPLTFYMGINRRKAEKIYDDMKERKSEVIEAWAGNYPYLKQSDVVSMSGLLYVVQYIPSYVYAPSTNSNKTFLVKQLFVLTKLDRNHQLYKTLRID